MLYTFKTVLTIAVLCAQLSSQSPILRRQHGLHHNHGRNPTSTDGLDTIATGLPVFTSIATANELFEAIQTVYVDAGAAPTATPAQNEAEPTSEGEASAPTTTSTPTDSGAESSDDSDSDSDSSASTTSFESAPSSTAEPTVEPSSEPLSTSSTSTIASTTSAIVSSSAISTSTAVASDSSSTFWTPAAGATWQIELTGTVSDIDYSADVFDLDLFDTPADTIASLHAQGKKVICYFSAGSFENWRPDAASFTAADKGLAMDGWAGEWWLDTRTSNVRSLMAARIATGAAKGCDGVDPDNVDGYDQDQAGVGLTEADALSYVTFLADTAHAAGVSVGLKNAAGLVDQVLPLVQWHVNEQCLEFDECHLFQPFIEAGKPVFHIEYPEDAGSIISTSIKSELCNGNSTAGFSTVLKTLELNAWVDHC